MNAYVVTESRFAAELLRRVLSPSLLEDAAIVPAPERSSAISSARTLLADRARPVALVLDSGTLDPKRVAEQALVVGDLLRMARPDVPISMVFADPELEAVLFQDPAGLARALQVPIAEDELRVAPYTPARILRGLLARSRAVADREALVAALDKRCVEALRGHPIIRDAGRFLAAAIPVEEPVTAEV
jgi:hypothetical protein